MITKFIEIDSKDYEHLYLSKYAYIGSHWQNDSQPMNESISQEIDLAQEVLQVRIHYSDQWEDAYFVKDKLC